MTKNQQGILAAIALRLFADVPRQSVSQWCEESIRFNEPGCTGPFSFAGREYLRECVDNESDSSVTDEAFVMGTRTGKTRVFYARTGWAVANNSTRTLYVKPKTKGIAGAEDDAANRFIPMLRSSPVLSVMIPTGSERFRFKTGQQVMGGSIIDWTGSNSVAALASNPCGRVLQDETDKFNTTRKRDDSGQVVEADAGDLADERTKECPNPKRLKASTPTLTKGAIWQALLKTDLRRYFMPCPHCAKHVVFAWSEDFTVLPKTGCEAYMKWDGRTESGWDFDEVKRSAHAECPHCKGRILDQHKPEMIRRGEWRATQQGLPRHRGYHLSSLYANHVETSFGALAVKFLKNKNSHAGLRGFINSDLAEPYQNQDRLKAMHVMIKSGLRKNRGGIPDRGARYGMGDKQKGRKELGQLPHWWHVIMDVKRFPDGNLQVQIVSEGKELTDANLVQVFKDHEVTPGDVILDSGYDTENVYALCMDKGYHCLKAEGDKLFAGHADGGRKIFAPPKPVHTMVMNHAPKFEYLLVNGVWQPHPQEPMFFHVSKFLLMEFFNWMRSAKHVAFEVPGDVSDEFKKHMNAWGVIEKRIASGEIEERFKQFDDDDHLYQCCCYGALMMLYDEAIEWTVDMSPRFETPAEESAKALTPVGTKQWQQLQGK